MSDYDSYSVEEMGMPTCHIRPYQFEPLAPNALVQENAETEPETGENNNRIGTLGWCVGEHCKAMETNEESIWDKEEVPLFYFGVGERCITQIFLTVCLNAEILKTTLAALNNRRGDRMETSNRSMRYAAYRQFTCWVHDRLGRGVRKAIPSCAVLAIRDAYPENGMVYVPFLEEKDEIAASIQ